MPDEVSKEQPNIILRMLREPLLHFAVLGAIIFAAYGSTHDPSSQDERTIVVDRSHLLTFLQYRSKAFDTAYFSEVLDTMSDQALADLIKDYVEEEAMYREAKSLRLDERDYVARRRLVQQLEFITRGFIADVKPLSDEELAAYYKDHVSDYTQPPKITFTHVFFDNAKHGEETQALAKSELAKLKADKTPFTQSMAHGDRALYDVNYVEADPETVTSHFGPDMAKALFSLTPSSERWQGPFESKYGYHLVMVTDRTEGGAPPLETVKEKVQEDATAAQRKELIEQAVQSIVKSYRVKIVPVRRNSTAPKS